MYRPTESEVAAAQASLGLDALQARRHCEARAIVAQKVAQQRDEAYRRCLRSFIEDQRAAALAAK